MEIEDDTKTNKFCISESDTSVYQNVETLSRMSPTWNPFKCSVLIFFVKIGAPAPVTRNIFDNMMLESRRQTINAKKLKFPTHNIKFDKLSTKVIAHMKVDKLGCGDDANKKALQKWHDAVCALIYYKPFSAVYGKSSSIEKEVPSKMNVDGKDNRTFVNSIDCTKFQARMTVKCSVCLIPWIVYSRKKTKAFEMELLKGWIDNVDYVYEFPLFEKDPPFSPVEFTTADIEIQMKNSVRCNRPVERNIYQLSPNIYFHCGKSTEGQAVW